MPQIDWLPLLTFVFITNFTPGPNVIPAMSIGIMAGFRRAMRFCAGVLAGYIFLMLASAFAATALLRVFPGFKSILRVAGALYIGWLAVSTFRKSLAVDLQDQDLHGFWHGLFMQFVNVKGLLFGLTLFSTFLAPLRSSISWQLWGVAGISLTAFSAAVTYAAFGSVIRRTLSNARIRRIISISLSALLFITALRILGMFDWIKTITTG